MVHRERIYLVLLLLAGTGVMLSGISWGLPSPGVDRFLFGHLEPWTGERVQALAGERPRERGVAADVDHSPLPRDRVVHLNAGDEDRAALVRRYRLYTYQPDEMQTMMSLAEMRPGAGDFDPRMYKYGGLWIYPVGALLRVGSAMGLVTLRPDLGYYLDRPEAFGRFYVVARLYSVFWGLVGIWVVFRLGCDLSGRLWPGVGAGALLTLMPVVVAMSHEAKPHLAGAVLMLLAVWAGVRWVELGTRRWAVVTGVMCGAAFGMVLSSLWAFAVAVVMVMLRPLGWGERAKVAGLSVAVGVGVYLLTNPYVGYNLLVNPEVVRSNLENSAVMYAVGEVGEGFVNAVRLVGEGASWGVVAGGVVALVGLAVGGMTRRGPQAGVVPQAVLVLLGAPAVLVFVQFVGLAAGWPGEYGRFGVYLCAALAVVVPAGIGLLPGRAVQAAVFAAVLMWTAWAGGTYLRALARDTGQVTGRLEMAAQLEALRRQGHGTLGLLAEPAPYSVPPFNLFEWEVLLLPQGYDPGRDEPVADVIVRAVDFRRPLDPAAEARYLLVHPPMGRFEAFRQPMISWADKPFEVLVRRDERPQP